MARYIEYYELVDNGDVRYQFMPIDRDAFDKSNLDRDANRIWKYDTVRNTFAEVKNPRKLPEVSAIDFLKIRLLATPVGLSEAYYYRLRYEEAKKKSAKP